MKIISRYVLKEHVGPLLFAGAALTSLLLLNYVAKQFGNLVGKGLGWDVIGEFFLLSVPFTIAMTLPMAVLVATLYAFSRLAAENEITALKASGVSLRRLLIPVIWGAAAIAAIMLGFNDQVLPRANHRLRVLQGDILRKKPTFAIREQVINEVSPGRLYLRAGRVEQGSSHLREVTIYDLADPARRRTIYADSGRMGLTADRRDLQLTLFDGYMQELSKAEPEQLQRLFYEENQIRVRGIGSEFSRTGSDDFKSDREMSICEMQQEVAKARQDARRARAELVETFENAVTRVASGEARPGSGRRADYRERWPVGLAGLYCDILAPVLDIREAQAAPPDPVPQGRPEPRAGGRTAATTIPAVSGALEGARARITSARQTIQAFDVEIHKKFALSAACVVFVLLGAPIALRFPRGGVGLVLTVSIVVFALYYIGLIAGESLADRGFLSPFLAMWGANVLFTAVALVLLARMGREASTSRGGDMGELLEQLRVWTARQARKVGVPMDRRRRTA